MENWKRREKTLTAIPFRRYWRATLIKRGGDSGQLARLILKRWQRAPESPLIISLLLQQIPLSHRSVSSLYTTRTLSAERRVFDV